MDLDYHLRHSALPYPGGERELGILVSRLHSNPMDMDRPLWEIHLIEGLHGGRFALYGKLHHSLADGVSGVGLLNFSENPKSSRTPPIWAQTACARSRRSVAGRSGAQGFLPPALVSQARALPNLLRGLAGSARAAIGMKSDPDFTSLAEAPRTIFNTNITPQRRVATQTTSLARMKAIGDAAGGSVNDVLLAACGAALRRYLTEIEQAAAQVTGRLDPGGAAARRERRPAAMRSASRTCASAPTSRTSASGSTMIRRSSAAGRAYLKQMSSTALIDYTVLISSPQMLTRLPGIGSRVPPIYNVIISNVPGPRGKLYFLGAEMEAYYPISALAHGQALNITVMSYAGGLYFGFTALPGPGAERAAARGLHGRGARRTRGRIRGSRAAQAQAHEGAGCEKASHESRPRPGCPAPSACEARLAAADAFAGEARLRVPFRTGFRSTCGSVR